MQKAEQNFEVTLINCEDEPIHIPNCIQSFGFMWIMEKASCRILQVSQNVEDFLEQEAEQVIGTSIKQWFEKEDLKLILKSIENGVSLAINPIRVTLNHEEYNIILHQAANPALIIIECEPVRNTNIDYASFYDFLNLTIAKFQQVRSSKKLYEAAAEQVRFVTGYDRVMVYKFDSEWNGEVVAEAKRKDLKPFLGLHYPATDIPAQARALYLRNWTRMIVDIDYKPAPIVPRLNPLDCKPIDMSDTVLRSISPIHIEYLKNMGVAATLTISLITEGKLWGLIACHHYSPKFNDYNIRKTAEFIGKILSYQISMQSDMEAEHYVSHMRSHLSHLLDQMVENWQVADGLMKHDYNVLNLFDCTGVALLQEGELHLLGKTPAPEHIYHIVSWLDKQNIGECFHTNHLAGHIPELGRIKALASGLLAIPISAFSQEYILWFRPEETYTVEWAGNPEKNFVREDNSIRLSPRKSFNKWKQRVHQKSKKWLDSEIQIAKKLRVHVMEIVVRTASEIKRINKELSSIKQELEDRVGMRTTELKNLNQKLQVEIAERIKTEQALRHAKELAEEMNRLKSNFLANMSHEVRTPINGIIGLAQVIENEYGNEHREIKSYTQLIRDSGKRLLQTIMGILNMARMEAKSYSFALERIEVSQAIDSVMPLFRGMAKQKQIKIEVQGTEQEYYVHVDKECFEQILNNLIGNAIKFTKKGKVTLKASESYDSKGMGYFVLSVSDTGVGITKEFLPHVFTPFEQESQGIARQYEGSGLGLSIAKRYIELFDGTISVESIKNKGTTFKVKLPLQDKERKIKI
ncbi:MAG: GAF domain-containing protein [Bernardetiaceae bacterium]|nr:GAF domain-containing protein [Bernardetiaceae bacterium]